jgi:hypothetical protein
MVIKSIIIISDIELISLHFLEEEEEEESGASFIIHSLTHSLTYSLDVSSQHKNSRYVFSAEYGSGLCHCLSFRMLCCSKLYCN